MSITSKKPNKNIDFFFEYFSKKCSLRSLTLNDGDEVMMIRRNDIMMGDDVVMLMM